MYTEVDHRRYLDELSGVEVPSIPAAALIVFALFTALAICGAAWLVGRF